MSQLILNILITTAGITLVGCGFSIIYSTTRFFHFAHGVVFTSGAYLVLVGTYCRIPLLLSLAISVLLCSLLGCIMERSIYRPLRKKNTPPSISLLASLGIYIVLQNTISLLFGDEAKSIRVGPIEEGINIFGARITPIQVIIILLSGTVVAVLTIILKKTEIGKSIRAVADNPELASIAGIKTDNVILSTFGIGSALAGLAGALIAMDVNMTPIMGINALMMGVIVAVIGGIGSIPGVVLAALLIASAQHISVWKISSQWQEAIAFAILLGFLVLKPEGFMGKKLRKASV